MVYCKYILYSFFHFYQEVGEYPQCMVFCSFSSAKKIQSKIIYAKISFIYRNIFFAIQQDRIRIKDCDTSEEKTKNKCVKHFNKIAAYFVDPPKKFLDFYSSGVYLGHTLRHVFRVDGVSKCDKYHFLYGKLAVMAIFA